MLILICKNKSIFTQRNAPQCHAHIQRKRIPIPKRFYFRLSISAVRDKEKWSLFLECDNIGAAPVSSSVEKTATLQSQNNIEIPGIPLYSMKILQHIYFKNVLEITLLGRVQLMQNKLRSLLECFRLDNDLKSKNDREKDKY